MVTQERAEAKRWSLEHTPAARPVTRAPNGAGRLCAATEPQRLPISSLRLADSPRLGGENVEHTNTLANVGAALPPILVHRASMRVIDGTHRVRAALLRNAVTIEARYFEGSVQEAFVMAVKANIQHGLPLTPADRTAAVERIIASYPAWSDRAIAEITGLSARKVASIRRHAELGVEERVRMGRDGRIRPLDKVEGRTRASEVIRSRPNASVREIAKAAGVSPTTALDVRNRLHRGESVAPAQRLAQRRRDPPAPQPECGQSGPEASLAAILRGLKNDPALRFSESGRDVLRWLVSRVIYPGERQDVADHVPLHSTYIVADVARHCADEWSRLADDLKRRARQAA
jgi:ParB-like chromosome segregation protein Spo0J